MSKIGAIVLAAGMSKRMGQPKMLLPLNGKPLFRYPLELCLRSELDHIVLVGGQHLETFRKMSVDLHGIEFLSNERFADGMSSSLKKGIERMVNRTDAVFIFLGDQPFVPDRVIKSMVKEYNEGDDVKIVRPKYDGDLGHPILINKSLFPEFLKLVGDQGGREVINKYRSHTIILPFEQSHWGMDIDSVEDYRRSKEYSHY